MTFVNYAKLKITAPQLSKIKILNIKDQYKDDILLKKGKYHIQVSKKGYNTYDKWIKLYANTNIKIILKKYKATKPMINATGYIVWKDNFNPHPFKNIEKIGNVIWEKSVVPSSWYEAKKRCENLKYESDGFIIENFRLPSLQELKSRYKVRGKKGLPCRGMWSSKSHYTFEICSWQRGKALYNDNNNKNNFGLCVSPGHYIYKNLTIIELANRLNKELSNKSKKLDLPKKPKMVSYKKIVKDEFETTKRFNERVVKSNEKIDQENENNLIKWEKIVANKKQKYKKILKQLEDNKDINYLKLLQKSMHLKYGSPKIINVQYDADNQVFDIRLKSTIGKYNKNIKVPVKIKYAKKFKKLLVDKNFKPTVEFTVKNSQLIFSAIKEIKDPELFVEDNAYKKAYSLNNSEKSVLALQSFISTYPNSSFIFSAKDRITELQKKIKIRKEKQRIAEEKRKIEEEKRRKENEKIRKRKEDSFYAKKSRGDKVCMDGTVSLFLSITITAYVENTKGNNIQLRIADTEGTNPYVKGVRLYRNTLIWDDYTNWYKCDY